MDITELRVFEAVARLGSMTRAAAELHTVQSNVTARVHALEKELGTALFRRHSRGVALTDAGRRLLPYATQIESLVAEAHRAARDDGTPQGALAVGSLETTAAYRLPPVIAAYGLAHPSVELTLTVGTNARLIDLVLEHALDGAFVCAPIQHPDLMAEVVFREELVLATAPGAISGIDRLTDGKCTVLVKGPGCAYRQRLETLLAQRGAAEVRHVEFGTLDAIIGCTAAGLGFTLLPYSVLAGAHHEGRISLHRLPAAEATVDIVFIRRCDVYESSAIRAFLTYSRKRPEPDSGQPSTVPAAAGTEPAGDRE